MNELCERLIPTIVSSPKTGRFVAAYSRPCRKPVVDCVTVTPPTPDEPQFEVEVCLEHAAEIIDREPLDPERYTYCGDCHSYADLTTGICGCP